MSVDYSGERGQRFISVGATGSYGQVPPCSGLSASAGTAGNSVAFLPDKWGDTPRRITWDTVMGGTGSFSAVSIDLEVSVDNGANWRVLDTSTAAAGEVRVVVNPPSGGAYRIKPNTLTIGSLAPRVTAGIIAG